MARNSAFPTRYRAVAESTRMTYRHQQRNGDSVADHGGWGMTGINVAPGSVVVVRDEEWLVTAVDQTRDGRLLHCQGLSELVRDTTASFYEGLEKDNIQVLD